MRNELSRRQFIKIAGGSAGMMALASMGIPTGWATNNPSTDTQNFDSVDQETDTLVIGGGMAGLFAAVKAHDSGSRVMLVSKGQLGTSGQTPFAKGIFCFDPKKSSISIDEFLSKVRISAMGTNNPVYTRQMAENSMARVNELREWGYFDSPLCHNAFSKPIKSRGIPVFERIHITHLIKEKGRIAGAAGFSLDEKKIYFFRSRSVILCTGAGGFKPNGFPICDLTHDGTVMAYQIGAKVTGKEWNDGHVGQATNAAACFDGWHGMFEETPNTTGVSVRHDLGVDLNYQAYKNGNPVVMTPPRMNNDGTLGGEPHNGHSGDKPEEGKRRGPPEEGNRRRRPPQGKGQKGEGHPPGMMGTPVGGSSAGMAIHKSEGLVPINDKCESNIKGLFAAGDALGSYMAGAIYTQIGSSLAGSAVQGAVAGESASAYCKSCDIVTIGEETKDKIRKEILAPLKREAGYSPAWVTQTLQGVMIPNFVLYIKKEAMLKAALCYIEELRDHHMPLLRAADLHELRLAHETTNMIITAEMKLKASIMRKESRCSHFRLDYPQADKENWQAWINIYKGENGEMKFEKQAFIDC